MFTCSAIGKLSNVLLNEKIPLKNTNPTGRILKLVSNYYEQINISLEKKKNDDFDIIYTYYYLDGKEYKECPRSWINTSGKIKDKYNKKYKIELLKNYTSDRKKILKKKGENLRKKIKIEQVLAKVGSFDSCITFWVKSSFKEGKIYILLKYSEMVEFKYQEFYIEICQMLNVLLNLYVNI